MDMQDGDVVSTYADTNDLIKDFNYKPDTKLADGIEQFVVWYKDFYFKEEKQIILLEKILGSKIIQFI